MSLPFKSKADKVEWLLANAAVWEGYPNASHSHASVFAAMQAAGLYKPGSRWQGTDISPLIAAARKERRGRRFQFRRPPKTDSGKQKRKLKAESRNARWARRAGLIFALCFPNF